MKKLVYLIIVIVVLGLIVTGCIPVVPPAEQSESSSLTKQGPYTWYVDGVLGTDDVSHGTGIGVSAFKTIQYAINDSRVQNSDTISVATAIYIEQVTINKSITLQAGSMPTIDVSSAQDTNNPKGSVGIEVIAPNVTIDGFEIIGVPTVTDSTAIGFTFSSGAYSTIRASSCADGLTIQNCVFNTTSPAHIALVVMDGVDDVSFLNNIVNDYIYGVTGRGNVNTVDNLLVQGNTFNQQTYYLEGPYSGVYQYLCEGVQLWVGDGLRVIDNTFTGPCKFADQFETVNLVNVFAVADFNKYFGGVSGTGNELVEITGNEIQNYYLGIGTFSGGTIQNNSICDLTVGIQIGQKDPTFATAGITDTLNITGNDILNNLERGIWVQLTSGEQVEVHCNNIVGNGEFGVEKTNIIDEPSVIVDATHNWWGHATGPSHSSNPGGIGDAVSDNVNYDNWAYIPDFCDCEAKTIGYWKNHPDYVDGILEELGDIGVGTETVDEDKARLIFDKPNSKTYQMLAAQLLAAKLNVAQLSQFFSEPDYDFSCRFDIGDEESMTVIEAAEAADLILVGDCGYPYSERVDKDDKERVNIPKSVLDDFNNNGCPLNVCPCECYY